jgi:hypothetical protein
MSPDQSPRAGDYSTTPGTAMLAEAVDLHIPNGMKGNQEQQL